MAPAKRTSRGLTLMELLLASALLALAAVPIVDATGRAVDLAYRIQTQTRATLLAQQEMETARAAAAAHFSRVLARQSQDLGDGYRVTIEEVSASLRKTLTVKVGRDTSGNGVLDVGEVLATLVTQVPDLDAYGG